MTTFRNEAGFDLAGALGEAVAATPRAVAGAWGAVGLTAALALIAAFSPLSGTARSLVVLAAAASVAVLFGALMRILVLEQQGLGPAGLQLRKLELRLAGGYLLCALFLAMILAVAGLAILAMFGIAELDANAIRDRRWAEVGAPWKLVVLTALSLAALAAPVLLAVRVSLFAPATAAMDRMMSLNSAGFTRGRTVQLLLGYVVLGAPLSLMLVTWAATGQAAVLALALVEAVLIHMPLAAGFMTAGWRRRNRSHETGSL